MVYIGEFTENSIEWNLLKFIMACIVMRFLFESAVSQRVRTLERY